MIKINFHQFEARLKKDICMQEIKHTTCVGPTPFNALIKMMADETLDLKNG